MPARNMIAVIFILLNVQLDTVQIHHKSEMVVSLNSW